MQPTQVEATRTRAPPTMHATTLLFVERIKGGALNDVYTDEQATKDSGFDCAKQNGNGRRYLASAMRHVLNNYQVAWLRRRGANAIVCVPPEEVEAFASSQMKSINRKSKRTAKVLATVDLQSLDDTARNRHLLQRAHIGTVAQASGSAMYKKLEARNVRAPLDIGKMLENLKTTTT